MDLAFNLRSLVFHEMEPRRLREAARRVAVRAAEGRDPDPVDYYPTAIREVEDGLRHGIDPVLTRKHLAALVRSFEEVPTPELQAAVVQIAVVGAAGWRKLWRLWRLSPVERSLLCGELARRLAARAADRPRFAERRLPKWLPKEHRPMDQALRNPMQAIQDYVESAEIPAPELFSKLEIPAGGDLGRSVYGHLITHGSPRWWSRTPRAEILVWAATLPLDLQRLVANRLLVEHGGTATSAGDIEPAENLLNWVTQHLGMPEQNPHRWRGVSARALQVFEWLFVSLQFAKILEEFGRHAEQDRVQFWKSYIGVLDDALFIEATTTPVCLMVFRQVLVIEFGHVNNACYLYRAPNGSLRSLKALLDPPPRNRWDTSRTKPSDFKSRWGLKIGDQRVAYLTKLSHLGPWTSKFRRTLSSEHGISPRESR